MHVGLKFTQVYYDLYIISCSYQIFQTQNTKEECVLVFLCCVYTLPVCKTFKNKFTL